MKTLMIGFLMMIVLSSNASGQSYDSMSKEQLDFKYEKAKSNSTAGGVFIMLGLVSEAIGIIVYRNGINTMVTELDTDGFGTAMTGYGFMVAGIPLLGIGIPLRIVGGNQKEKCEIALLKFTSINNKTPLYSVGFKITF
jgi:hypothetical protein